MDPKLSKYLAGIHKNHTTRRVILETIETWHSMLSKGNKVGEIVMDPPKTFDVLSHNLLLCKIEAYDFHPKLFF